MPRISRAIDGCACNPELHVLAFSFKGRSVVIERKKAFINEVKDAAEAKMVIVWLASIINGSNEQAIKQEAE